MVAIYLSVNVIIIIIVLDYKFDFQDSIKWSSNDIAIVKVDKPFKLGVLEKDCEFATAAISYNNVSHDLEKAGTKGWIAGWGSGSNFREVSILLPRGFHHHLCCQSLSFLSSLV